MINKRTEALKLLKRIADAEAYFDDLSVPKEDKEKCQDKYNELLVKRDKMNIRKSDMNGELFIVDKGSVCWLKSGVVYDKKEMQQLKHTNSKEIKQIHKLKEIFNGRIISIGERKAK